MSETAPRPTGRDRRLRAGTGAPVWRVLAWSSIVAVCGCSSADNDRLWAPEPHPMWSKFPFDGHRQWLYSNTDESSAYLLHAESDGVARREGGFNLYSVRYTTQCLGGKDGCFDGQLLFSADWSSDSNSGVLVHSVTSSELELYSFQPAVRIAADDMTVGQVVATTVDGVAWTSELASAGACPSPDFAQFDCVTFAVSSDSSYGGVLTGEWAATETLGVVAFRREFDAGQWQLVSVTCEPDEACDGSW
jgi:hypothetical protein